jgi:hypothetical protein
MLEDIRVITVLGTFPKLWFVLESVKTLVTVNMGCAPLELLTPNCRYMTNLNSKYVF